MDLQYSFLAVDNSKVKAVLINLDNLPPDEELDLPTGVEKELWFQEFVQSIFEHGQLEPIQVNKLNNQYDIIAGNKRLKALRILDAKFPGGKWSKILAIVRELDEETAMLDATVSNAQRRENIQTDLKTIRFLIKKHPGISEKSIARMSGINPQTLKLRLRLLKMDEGLQVAIEDGRMSATVAKEVASLPASYQKDLVQTTASKKKITLDDVKKVQQVRVDDTVRSVDQVKLFPPTAPKPTKEQIYREALEEIASIVFNYDATPEAARKAVEIAEKALA